MHNGEYCYAITVSDEEYAIRKSPHSCPAIVSHNTWEQERAFVNLVKRAANA